jgi:hypothetical protein
VGAFEAVNVLVRSYVLAKTDLPSPPELIAQAFRINAGLSGKGAALCV